MNKRAVKELRAIAHGRADYHMHENPSLISQLKERGVEVNGEAEANALRRTAVKILQELAKKAPPGSQKAENLGCLCPVMDNHNGKGYRGQRGVYIVSKGCPLHNPFNNAIR